MQYYLLAYINLNAIRSYNLSVPLITMGSKCGTSRDVIISNKSLHICSNGSGLHGPGAMRLRLMCLDQVLELLEQMLLDLVGGGGSDVWIHEITVV